MKDTVTTKYIRQNEIFADAFNYFIYGGEQIIAADCLEELDTREVDVPYGGPDGAGQPVQRIRDVIKSVTAMTDKKRAYLVLSIENQSGIHYAMAVKNMVCDALQYAKQVESAAASRKRAGNYSGISGDEYLSGFTREDHLMPVVTLVIYFGVREWDGPLSIHEMFGTQDAKVLTLVPNYKINLIMPADIQDEDFGKFHSTLREILSFIKYSKDADKLAEIVENNERFRHLNRTELDVLNACTSAELTMKEEEEECDVCLAIQTMKEKAAKEAAREVAQKACEQNVKIMSNLMKTMGWTAEQSMDAMGISEKDLEKLRAYL